MRWHSKSDGALMTNRRSYKMDTTLVVMAAGIGSRFGGGIKQLEPMGPNGEIIMDYAIYDAKEAGFNKVVFIIRKDLEEDFKEIIGNRVEKVMPVAYAFQELDNLPEGFELPADRTKPWGTGQAVLACKGIVDTPFVVINADDYYGKEAFVKVHDFLTNSDVAKEKEFLGCMPGFVLGNTLSENGTVKRGICKVEDEMLVDIEETCGIEKKDGKVICEKGDGIAEIDPGAYASMNMWGLYPDFIDELERRFVSFLENLKPEEETKKEFLLPIIIQEMLQEDKIAVRVLESQDKWFGVTYKEDKPTVVKEIAQLHEQGLYPNKL